MPVKKNQGSISVMVFHLMKLNWAGHRGKDIKKVKTPLVWRLAGDPLTAGSTQNAIVNPK